MKVKSLFFQLSLSFLVACGSNNPSTKVNLYRNFEDLKDMVAVINHSPADFEGNVPVSATVTINFSGSLSYDSIDSFKIRIIDENGILVPTQLTTSSDRSAVTITPYYNGRQINLLKSTTYHVYTQSLRSEYKSIEIPDYYFKFRTVNEVEGTSNFKVDRISPSGTTILPTSTFQIYFTEPVEPPHSNDVPGRPECSRTEWADAFQVVSIPILTSVNTFRTDTVSGILCLDTSNQKKLTFYPDHDLGVDNQGSLFSDGSVARITIRSTDSLRSATTSHKLAAAKVYNRTVVPGISYLLDWYDQLFGN